MPKTIEKAPETLAECEAMFPDLIAQARDEGKASIDVEAIRASAAQGASAQAVAEARAEEAAKAAAERERMMGLITLMYGEDLAKKIQGVLASGVTVDQYRAIGGVIAPPGSDAEAALKRQLLAAITAAGADNPGAGGNTPATSPTDWPSAVNTYQTEHKCSRTEAIEAIETAHPGLRTQYLSRINAKKEASHA